MQRDIGDLPFWHEAEPIPAIVPPILNKDTYLRGAYLSGALELMRDKVSKAEIIVSLGFSLPPSDSHIADVVRLAGRSVPVGLVFRASAQDATLRNWEAALGSDRIVTISDCGMPVHSLADIDRLRLRLREFACGN